MGPARRRGLEGSVFVVDLDPPKYLGEEAKAMDLEEDEVA
jgi:hypothetical protein